MSVNSNIEKRYMTHRRRKIYTALEDLNFLWDWDEVKEFIHMWKAEIPFGDIVEHFRRDPDEIGLLIMDLARKGRIKPRKRGIH